MIDPIVPPLKRETLVKLHANSRRARLIIFILPCERNVSVSVEHAPVTRDKQGVIGVTTSIKHRVVGVVEADRSEAEVDGTLLEVGEEVHHQVAVEEHPQHSIRSSGTEVQGPVVHLILVVRPCLDCHLDSPHNRNPDHQGVVEAHFAAAMERRRLVEHRSRRSTARNCCSHRCHDPR